MMNTICPAESEDSLETDTVHPVRKYPVARFASKTRRSYHKVVSNSTNTRPGISCEFSNGIHPAKKNRKNNHKLPLSECAVFFDFDNTITPFDVIDDLVECFSINEKWQKIEKDWKRGKIGSKECLKRQFAEVRVKKDVFINYLSKIKIDKYFPRILTFLKQRKASVCIVSDSSSFIIDNILKNNGIKGVKVYSNRLKFNKDKLLLKFPHFNKKCPKCANCKKSHLRKDSIDDKIIIYIGDGLSDICAAECADITFAKASLLKHFRKQKRDCLKFDTLAVVYNYLKEIAQ